MVGTLSVTQNTLSQAHITHSHTRRHTRSGGLTALPSQCERQSGCWCRLRPESRGPLLDPQGTGERRRDFDSRSRGPPEMCCWRQLGRTSRHGTVEREGLSSPFWAVGPIVWASQLKLPWRRKEQGWAAYVSVKRCDHVWNVTVGEYVCEGAHECDTGCANISATVTLRV